VSKLIKVRESLRKGNMSTDKVIIS